jgi:RNase P subunit RPR2
MPRPEPGKKYLIVFCKSCDKAFRVVDSALDPAKKTPVPNVPVSLKCRGCGHVATYAPQEIRIAQLGPKPAKNRA